jgi:hypothetical protein
MARKGLEEESSEQQSHKNKKHRTASAFHTKAPPSSGLSLKVFGSNPLENAAPSSNISNKYEISLQKLSRKRALLRCLLKKALHPPVSRGGIGKDSAIFQPLAEDLTTAAP